MKICCLSFLVILFTLGCDSRYRDDLDYSYDVSQTWTIEGIKPGDLVQFESVDFDLVACTTIRQAIEKDKVAASRDVLQIGSGVGLVAAMCLIHEANSVLATDIQPAAISNTRYNVATLAPDGNLLTRQRPAGQQDAFSTIESDEKFDLIITNFDRSHDDQVVRSPVASQAFTESFLRGLSSHLRSGGRAIVLCNRPATFKHLLETCNGFKLKAKSLEEDFENRDWKSADTLLNPAILFEVRPELP